MGEEGVVAKALRQGEPAVTDNPLPGPRAEMLCDVL